jgi:glutamate--cysteine ligase catalytic subunit
MFTYCRYPSNKPDPKQSVSGSIMFPDQAIYQASLFLAATRNMKDRRGRGDKPTILVPVFRDENTPTPFRDDLAGYERTEFDLKQLKDDHIYMDGAPFGGSCCSLQVTTQCKSFDQVGSVV